MNQGFCKLVGEVAAYLDRQPDGADRLRLFMSDDKWLWGIEDVMSLTGWKRTYISQLCSSGKLPYIPGNPYKYIPTAVKQAIEVLQVGGVYGRRKGKALKPRK